MAFFSLIKTGIGIAAAFSAFFGYILYSKAITAGSGIASAGVFLLASGAASLNNIQDKTVDAKMSRTKKRPVVSGIISSKSAFMISFLLIVSGFAAIFMASETYFPLIAAISALVLYNGLYTPLKKKSSISFLPGILCGMTPPLIGWLAAGAETLSPEIIGVMTIFGLWQVPHFWLILLMRHDDYKSAGIKTLLDNISESQMKRLLFVWASGYALISLFIAHSFIIKSSLLIILVSLNSFVVIILFCIVFTKNINYRRYRFLYHYLNSSTMALAAISIFDLVK